MGLPPGRSWAPAPGIDSSTDPELAVAAGEVVTWIDYLLQPHSHDGPRIYRDRTPDHPDATDAEMPHRVPAMDEQSHRYQTVSVLEEFEADRNVLIRPAQAVAGIDDTVINATYDKLVQGCLTWSKSSGHSSTAEGSSIPITEIKYPELHSARIDWVNMRKSWTAPEDVMANEFEKDFVAFQVYTENALYAVAEHVVKYRAIFKKASEDMTALMKALTSAFARTSPYNGSDLTFDIPAIIISGLVGITTTVLTSGATAAIVFGVAVTELIGEAAKTAKAREDRKLLDNHFHLRDITRQYLTETTKIEKDTAEAIRQLGDNLRSEVERLLNERKYELLATNPATSSTVPHIRNYK